MVFMYERKHQHRMKLKKNNSICIKNYIHIDINMFITCHLHVRKGILCSHTWSNNKTNIHPVGWLGQVSSRTLCVCLLKHVNSYRWNDPRSSSIKLLILNLVKLRHYFDICVQSNRSITFGNTTLMKIK